jgi:hypothetical protein
MAQSDLKAQHLRAQRLLRTRLLEPSRAFAAGQERQALTLLERLVREAVPGSVEWAQLERLRGLTLIHVLREVEGTFALERADAVLDHADADLERPTLAWLETPSEPAGGDAPEMNGPGMNGADAEQAPDSPEHLS